MARACATRYALLDGTLDPHQVRKLATAHDQDRQGHHRNRHACRDERSLHAEHVGERGRAEQGNRTRQVVARTHGGVHPPHLIERGVHLDECVFAMGPNAANATPSVNCPTHATATNGVDT